MGRQWCKARSNQSVRLHPAAHLSRTLVDLSGPHCTIVSKSGASWGSEHRPQSLPSSVGSSLLLSPLAPTTKRRYIYFQGERLAMPARMRPRAESPSHIKGKIRMQGTGSIH